MAVRPPPPELPALLAPYPDELAETVLALRARVLRVLPNQHEVIWDAVNAVSIAFTPTTKWNDGFLSLATYSKHVNLAFRDGTTMPDPLGVLTGTGKHMRHASFRTVVDTEATWIGDYLRAAADLAGMPLTAGDGGRSLRVMAGVKRRPGLTR